MFSAAVRAAFTPSLLTAQVEFFRHEYILRYVGVWSGA
jgi:hypothetical protein